MSRLESIHLASSHTPFDTRIFHKECKTLAAAGYQVTLIVPHTHDEMVEGVRIKAVPLPEHGKERLFRTLGLIYRAALEESPHALYHVHDAELLFHMFRLKGLGRRVVYDVHEDTPKQVLYQHWIPAALRPPIAQVMRLAEWIAGRWFDGIIAAEPGILKRFPPDRSVLVHNFPRLEALQPLEAVPYAERPPRIVYVGSISEARGLHEMVAAIHRIPGALQARLVLGGPFHPAGLREHLAQLPGADRVDVLGWLNRQQVAHELAQSRMGIVTIHPTRKYLESYPTKLFEYMAAGLPVIASDFPEWRCIVEQAGCGLLVDPLDPGAIAEAVQWMLEHPGEAELMGQRGQTAVRMHYNWEQEAQTLLAFYERFHAP